MKAGACNETIRLPRCTQMTSSHGLCLKAVGKRKKKKNRKKNKRLSLRPLIRTFVWGQTHTCGHTCAHSLQHSTKTQTEESCCYVRCEFGDSLNRPPKQSKPDFRLQRTEPPWLLTKTNNPLKKKSPTPGFALWSPPFRDIIRGNLSECLGEILDKQRIMAFVYPEKERKWIQAFCCIFTVTMQFALHLPVGANQLCNAVISLMNESLQSGEIWANFHLNMDYITIRCRDVPHHLGPVFHIHTVDYRTAG